MKKTDFKNRSWLLLMTGFAILLQPGTADAQAEWLVAPYIWLSDVTLDQSAGASGGISASDLLDKSDAVGMIRIEAAGQHWGALVDYLWLGVSQSRNIPLGDLPISIGVNAEMDVTIAEFGGFYRPSGSDTGLDLLFGIRTIDNDTTLILIPPNGPVERFDGGSKNTDGYLGARYLGRIGEKWDYNLRGDYGFGDSEGSVNLIGTVGYRFNKTFAMNLGYRHFAVELEETESGESVTTDISLSGPVLGFLFRF